MTPRPWVRLLLPLSILLCFTGMDRPQFAQAATPATPATPAPAPQAAQADGDGDDPREELLYHWQDIRFSRDEQRQTVAIIAGLAALKLVLPGRKTLTRKRGTA